MVWCIVLNQSRLAEESLTNSPTEQYKVADWQITVKLVNLPNSPTSHQTLVIYGTYFTH